MSYAGKQLTFKCLSRFNNMLMHLESWQDVASAIKTKVCRVADANSPCSHPLPKASLSVALESPLARVAAVVHKEHGQHFRRGHDAQEFGLIAELHVIIWRRCGSAGKAVRRALKHLNDQRPRLAGVAFQDAGFVQNDANKISRVEFVQHFIVRDDDVGASLDFGGRAAILDVNAKLRSLFDCLLRNTQRRSNQHHAARVFGHLARPLGLHCGLT